MKKVRTVGCFLEHNGAFLILQRDPAKPYPYTWGLPAGKVDPGETDSQAMIRELAEEAGYQARPEELELLGYQLFRDEQHDVTFPTFRVVLDRPLQVNPRPGEHLDSRWVTGEECRALPNPIPGLLELLEQFGYIEK